VRLDYVPVTVESPCGASPEQAFATIVPIGLPSILRARGPLPGVRGVRDQSGPWNAAGRSRTVELTDGSTAAERIVEYTPPHSFAYEVAEFTGLPRWAGQRVRGEWTMTPDGAGCLVRWTYSCYPKPGRLPLLRVIAPLLWRGYARVTSAAAVAAAEQAV
jgi:hypothetical protein